MVWTMEQVLALAPDANSAKAGQQLSSLKHWGLLGQQKSMVWGECQGSGKLPYRTQIDLSEPAFRCTCPSRKFPCKHALGLFLIFASDPTQLSDHSLPDWVQEWLEKRSQTNQKKQEKVATKPVDAAAQAKRMTQREAKIIAGLTDLERWLRDSLRQGLAPLQTQPYSYWDGPASRLVDAQAPALAKRVRTLASLPQSGAGWPERLLAQLGLLYSVVQGYQRLASLPSSVQAELRTQVGWTIKQDELLDLANHPTAGVDTCQDTWQVLGRRVVEEDQLLVQRIWIKGASTQRLALLLSFTHRSQALDCSVWPGTVFTGELTFYPGLYPLRAVIKRQEPIEMPWTMSHLRGDISVEKAMTQYGEAMAQNPWLETFPMLLANVVPLRVADGWQVVDQAGVALPLDPGFMQGWTLLALSGGHPMQLFGEWNGQSFLPLGLGVTERWLSLEAL